MYNKSINIVYKKVKAVLQDVQFYPFFEENLSQL